MPVDPVEIKLAQMADLPGVLALVGRYPEAPHWSVDAWREYLQADSAPAGLRRSLFLAHERRAGEPAGLIAVTLLADVTELELVLVCPDLRRLGVGSALLRYWLQWAAGQGATQALLEVRASNEAAQRTYLRTGFQEQGVRTRYYPDPMEDAVLMSLQLGTCAG